MLLFFFFPFFASCELRISQRILNTFEHFTSAVHLQILIENLKLNGKLIRKQEKNKDEPHHVI